MKTYQDYLQSTDKQKFILAAIQDHKNSFEYRMAVDAKLYDRQLNPTILSRQKTIRNANGTEIVDIFAPNNRISSNFFNQLVSQENQYLLSNGVDWGDEKKIIDTLGEKFDVQLQKGGRAALVQRCSFGFWNVNKIVFFEYVEFVPLWDEITGELMAGIRFWQIENDKPLNIVFYEQDGFTEWILKNDVFKNTQPKRPYKQIKVKDFTGERIQNGETYSRLPIFPLWANENHDSELLGSRPSIDLYDRVLSDFGNDCDRNAMIYWLFTNVGGATKDEILKVLETLKKDGVAAANEGEIIPKTIDIPYEARKTILDILKKRIYEDFGGFIPSELTANVTATAIESAYMPLDLKCDSYEYCVIEFLQSLCNFLGFENVAPKFKRAKLESKEAETAIKQSEANIDSTRAQTANMLEPYLNAEQVLAWIYDKLNIEDLEITAEIIKIAKEKQAESDSRFNLLQPVPITEENNDQQ